MCEFDSQYILLDKSVNMYLEFAQSFQIYIIIIMYLLLISPRILGCSNFASFKHSMTDLKLDLPSDFPCGLFNSSIKKASNFQMFFLAYKVNQATLQTVSSQVHYNSLKQISQFFLDSLGKLKLPREFAQAKFTLCVIDG